MDAAWNQRRRRDAWNQPTWRVSADDERLVHIKRLARLMDSEYRIPGTQFRFGLDPIVGLIPGFGNVATSLVSCALVWTMMRHGASGNVTARMALNIAVDSLVGAIPIVGNLFDFAFRANQRNVELLRRHYQEGAYQGSGRGIVAAVAVLLFVVLGLAVWGLVAMIAWLWHVMF